MRIIGGKFKGRRFHPPAKNWKTRPTTDQAKEALFNILAHQIDWENTRALDLFCGTGSITYECVSRGCKAVTAVDKFYGCIKFIKETSKLLFIDNEITPIKNDVFKFIKKTDQTYDFIFADPPYALAELGDIPSLIFEYNLLAPSGILVVEHGPNRSFEQHDNFQDARRYGDSIFSFFGHLPKA